MGKWFDFSSGVSEINENVLEFSSGNTPGDDGGFGVIRCMAYINAGDE